MTQSVESKVEYKICIPDLVYTWDKTKGKRAMLAVTDYDSQRGIDKRDTIVALLAMGLIEESDETI